MVLRKISVLSCLLLGACSSGNSSSMSGTTPQTPQPPVAPPATTLAAQPVGTTTSLAVHAGIEAFTSATSMLSGLVVSDVIANPTGQVVKTSSGFLFTLPNGDQAIIDTSAASTQRIAPNLYRAVIVPNATTVMFQEGTALTYSTFGVWDERNIAATSSRFANPNAVGLRGAVNGGVIAYGLKTEQMPVTGSATFTGSALGIYAMGTFTSGSFSSNNVKLVADFQTGRIGGSITNLAVIGTTTPVRLNDLYLSAGLINGTGFTGTVTAAANATDSFSDFAGSTGSFLGQFDGPNAAEASGTFLMTNEQLRLRLAGAFAATGQTTPAGQPTPSAPTPPTTLASAQPGTTFALYNRYGIEALSINNAGAVPLGRFATTSGATVTIASDGFSLTFADTTTSVFKKTAATAGPNGATLFTSDIAASSRQGRLVAGAGLTYAAYGSWDQLSSPPTAGLPGTSRNSVAAGVLAYGIRIGLLPTTGSATYSGGVTGLYFLPGDSGAITGGTTRLVADFSKSATLGGPLIGGAITNITGQSTVSGNARSLSDIFLSGVSSSTAAFAGDARGGSNVASADLATTSGNMSGAFFGPSGAEIAGTFNLSDIGLGINIMGAFGGVGQATPSGQPAPAMPLAPILDASMTLASVPVGYSFSGTGVTVVQLPVPVVGGPNTSAGLTRVTQTAAGLAFQFSGIGGAATLGADTKTNLGYFGPIKNADGATTGMIHLVENQLTYSSYGVWTQSTATAPAVPPALEATTSGAAVFVYGNPTTTATMPTSGTATYSGGITGHFSTEPTGFGVITSGVLTLNVDFARAVASGSVNNILAIRPGAGPGVIDRLNDVALRQSSLNDSHEFGGVAAALPTSGATLDLGGPQGNYFGRFYGPGAPEAAGAFYLTDGHNFMQAAFAGKK